MEIFINEVSLEGQYFNATEFSDALKTFTNIFKLINQINQYKKLYKEESRIFVNYEAMRNSNFNASLDLIRDKSLKRAFNNIVFNKLDPKEWRQERVHSPDDLFDLISDNNYKNIKDTSLAEVAERKLQNQDKNYLLINFINSSFTDPHPNIKNNCLITIIKNNDEVNQICLDGVDSELALECWLEYRLNLSRLEYTVDSKEPPRDEQTILKDSLRFRKTKYKYHERFIYYELATGYYWYVDNLHYAQAAHLEVFDKTGTSHLGEADLNGNVDFGKSDPNKNINL